jgi:hypothetical protein
MDNDQLEQQYLDLLLGYKDALQKALDRRDIYGNALKQVQAGEPNRKEWKLLQCNNCGIEYFLTQNYINNRRQDHEPFCCPNGHGNWYPGVTQEEKLKKQLRVVLKEADECRVKLTTEIENRDEEIEKLKRSRAYYKGRAGTSE